MSRRADNYVWADALVWKARRGEPHRHLTTDQMLQVALVHATLAAAGPGVEAEVEQNERAAAAAVAATEGTQRERQAARPPLRLLVCVACGHKHDPGAPCAGHKWRDSCPYVGTDCDRPKPGPPAGAR
jgi:hypothetical protein